MAFRRLRLAVALVLGACAAPSATAPVDGAAVVVDVVDGDTIVVDVAGTEEHVRLLGIDTPETVHPDRPVECFGPEASRRLAELLPPGTEVRLTRDVEARDRFGRLLAYVHRADDRLFVNLVLVEEGFADILSIAPNVAHAARLGSAAATARSEGRGRWGACPATGPGT